MTDNVLETLEIGDLLKLLPHRYPFLLIDRIVDVDGDNSATGIKNVTFNEPHFQGHFPGQPVMPGVLIIEAMAQVAGAIHPAVRLAEIEAARSTPPADLGAYDLVMRAFPKLWGQNSESMNEAVAILRQAIDLDPDYGRAHALLAWCLALSVQYLWTNDTAGTMAVAMDEVGKATGLIENDPTALTACGSAASLAGDIEKGLTFIEAALSLDPNNAWAWNRFGWVGIYQNEPENARARFERAMALSPLDPFAFNMKMGVGATLSLEGRWKEAAEIATDVVTRHPNVTWAYRMLASWAAMADDLATARWAARRFLELQPDFTIARHAALPVSRRLPHLQHVIAGLIRAGIPEK